MRLIDADALLAAMYHEAFENDASFDEKNPLAKWDSGLWVRYKMFGRCLESAPTIDAVPAVRCKECKYVERCTMNVTMESRNGGVIWRSLEFCSEGKRK